VSSRCPFSQPFRRIVDPPPANFLFLSDYENDSILPRSRMCPQACFHLPSSLQSRSILCFFKDTPPPCTGERFPRPRLGFQLVATNLERVLENRKFPSLGVFRVTIYSSTRNLVSPFLRFVTPSLFSTHPQSIRVFLFFSFDLSVVSYRRFDPKVLRTPKSRFLPWLPPVSPHLLLSVVVSGSLPFPIPIQPDSGLVLFPSSLYTLTPSHFFCGRKIIPFPALEGPFDRRFWSLLSHVRCQGVPTPPINCNWRLVCPGETAPLFLSLYICFAHFPVVVNCLPPPGNLSLPDLSPFFWFVLSGLASPPRSPSLIFI